MRKCTGLYPSLRVDATGKRVVSHAGSVLLAVTADKIGIGRGLSAALAPWRRPMAVHDPGKILLDLAISLAIGGDCLADIAQLRTEPAVFGHVASDPTVSRLIDTLTADAVTALKAIDAARAAARARAWKLAGPAAPDHDRSAKAPLVVDVDATLVTAHSEKQLAAATFKKGFGFHPIGAWADHGPGGTGETLAMLLRPGNAGSNTAADHISVVKAALAQLPASSAARQPGRRVLVRTDGAGGTHEFVAWLTRQRVQYSVGFTMTTDITTQVDALPDSAWTPAYDGDGKPHGAWVAELTGVLKLTGWPTGMRVIVRAERPHPGAQLKFTDSNGNRLTTFATNTAGGQLADLELRHRRRARCEDRIRNAKDTGLNNLPLKDFTQNQVWIEVVQLAIELTAWMQMLAFTGTPARTWEPKKLRHRLFSIAARIGRRARRTWLRLSAHAPHRDLLLDGLGRLRSLPQST
ncbi:IS1380 family transposase [Nakamurella multipartita]|uniref:Transposase IS4 family protein n=1 Tax=Nakamurella multipartita (strain ATCC 700099 / DSM 44233 / CIP 104796 / JCM 9543 / NBRC 105858 / Y-104) TaxID=479431 RepID=C8XI86_NAKMY|nr:IS1380 family transposase [Nakamurella multipartita]ACV78455.1 transposase IS4 family protein [Nakamurella multipartita DSM 44233]